MEICKDENVTISLDENTTNEIMAYYNVYLMILVRINGILIALDYLAQMSSSQFAIWILRRNILC